MNITTFTDATPEAGWAVSPDGIASGKTSSGAPVAIVWDDGMGDYEIKGSEIGTNESGTFADIDDLRVLLAD